jgi:hypothetical protein
MIASNEASIGYHSRVAIAATLGNLVHLKDIWSGGQSSTIDQELAYAESLSATRFFLESYGPHQSASVEEALRHVVNRLAHEERGEHLRKLIHDPNYIDSFFRRWRDSVSTFWTNLAAISGTGVFWLFAVWLFLFAYWRKKRISELKAAEWADEDAWMDSVPDEMYEALEEENEPWNSSPDQK